MKLVQFDNGMYGVKLLYNFLDAKDPVRFKWFCPKDVRRWAMLSTIVEAEAIAKVYQEHHKPLKYKFLAYL